MSAKNPKLEKLRQKLGLDRDVSTSSDEEIEPSRTAHTGLSQVTEQPSIRPTIPTTSTTTTSIATSNNNDILTSNPYSHDIPKEKGFAKLHEEGEHVITAEDEDDEESLVPKHPVGEEEQPSEGKHSLRRSSGSIVGSIKERAMKLKSKLSHSGSNHTTSLSSKPTTTTTTTLPSTTAAGLATVIPRAVEPVTTTMNTDIPPAPPIPGHTISRPPQVPVDATVPTRTTRPTAARPKAIRSVRQKAPVTSTSAAATDLPRSSAPAAATVPRGQDDKFEVGDMIIAAAGVTLAIATALKKKRDDKTKSMDVPEGQHLTKGMQKEKLTEESEMPQEKLPKRLFGAVKHTMKKVTSQVKHHHHHHPTTATDLPAAGTQPTLIDTQ